MSENRRLIINADDFGLSPGVNRGILEAFRDGVLSSVTMLVNLDFFEDAVSIARENPDVPIGIHLNLLWGRPIARPEQVPTLVDAEGFFPRSMTTMAWRYGMGQLSSEELRIELGEQVQRFLATGLRPTHIDTHKQTHCLPGIFEILLEVASAHGIERVRLPYEQQPLQLSRLPSRLALMRRLLPFIFRRRNKRLLSRAGFRSTDHLVGFDFCESFDEQSLSQLLCDLKPGVTEILCHPGNHDQELAQFSRIPPYRRTQLEALTSLEIKRQIEELQISLISFLDL